MTKKCIVMVDFDGDSVPYNMELTDEQIVTLDGHADIQSILSDGLVAIVLNNDKIEWHPIRSTTYEDLREDDCDCSSCDDEFCGGQNCCSCNGCDDNE